MFNDLLDYILKRKIMEGGVVIAEPTVKPIVRPTEVPKPGKPVNPIKPVPGVKPKPKALTNDVLLFLANRVESVSEMAFTADKFGNWVNKDKKYWIEHGDEIINSILPKIGNDEKTYLELLGSSEYSRIIAKLEKYAGSIPKSTKIPALTNALVKTLEKVITIEEKDRDKLAKLALDSVLSLDEFKLVKKAYENGDVKFDVSLVKPKVQDFQTEQLPKDGLSKSEQLNAELADALADIDDAEFRRRFANLMVAGAAIDKMYLFEYVADQLNAIDPKLVNLYGIISAIAELGYWVTPSGIESGAVGSAGGVSQVKPNGDIYVIKAKGWTFPYLVHEIVKGIYEWVLIDKDMQDAMDKETISDETKDILVGAGISKNIAKLIPASEQYLLPIVKKKLAWLSPVQVKSVLGNTVEGKAIIGNILSQARKEYDEFSKE